MEWYEKPGALAPGVLLCISALRHKLVLDALCPGSRPKISLFSRIADFDQNSHDSGPPREGFETI